MRHLVPAFAGVLALSTLIGAPAAQAGTQTCAGRTATIVGTNHADDLAGTELDDVVWLGNGKDHFDGAGGNDVVCGGGGKDALEGGVGDDKIFGEAGNDELSGDAGNDLVKGGDGKDTLAGGTDDDVLKAGPGDDYFHEDLGNDRIVGGPGRDWLSYYAFYTGSTGIRVNTATHTVNGAGHDTTETVETYEGTDAGDSMTGGPDNDDLRARSGENKVQGNGGDDYLEAFGGVVKGGAGDDYVSAGATAIGYLGAGNDSATVAFGSPTLYGEAGNDIFAVSKQEQHATLDGGTGENRITFRAAAKPVTANIGSGSALWNDSSMTFDLIHNIAGTPKTDHLFGSAVSDFIVGGAGNDVIKGMAGNDLIKGGPGIDSMDGGAGYDICTGEHYSGCEYSQRPYIA